jgi:hypothetical protein
MRLARVALALATFCLPRLALASEDAPPAPQTNVVLAGGIWAITQLIPSPLLVTGKDHVGGGLRWQLTPLLFSFGITERPFRTFIVSPIARHSGSFEMHASPEWACCASEGSGWLGRAGLRMYLPLLEYGEQLSFSVGGSYYRTTYGKDGFSADVGVYTLLGILGLTLTVSPSLPQRELITALNIRYF